MSFLDEEELFGEEFFGSEGEGFDIFGSEDGESSGSALEEDQEDVPMDPNSKSLGSGSLKAGSDLTAKRDSAVKALRSHQNKMEQARQQRDSSHYKLNDAQRRKVGAEASITEAERSAEAAKLAPRASAVPGEGRFRAGNVVRYKPQHWHTPPGLWTVESVCPPRPGFKLSYIVRQGEMAMQAVEDQLERPLLPGDTVKVAKWPWNVQNTLPFSAAAQEQGTLYDALPNGYWQVEFRGSFYKLPDNCLQTPWPKPDVVLTPAPAALESLVGGFHRLDKVRDQNGLAGVVAGVSEENPDLLKVAASDAYINNMGVERFYPADQLLTEEAYWRKRAANSREVVDKSREDEARLQKDLDKHTARYNELEAGLEALSKASTSAAKAVKRAQKNLVDIRMVTAVSFKTVKGKDQVPQVWRDVSKYVDLHWALALSRPARPSPTEDLETNPQSPQPGRPTLVALGDAKGFAKSIASKRGESSSGHIISVNGKALEALRKGRNKAVSFVMKRKLAKSIVKKLKPGAAAPAEVHSFALLKAALGAEENIVLSDKVQAFFDSPEIGIIRAKEVPPPDCVANSLRPYQLTGYHWLVNNARNGLGCILADDMGLGKTLQAISLMLYLKSNGLLTKPMLVVVPTGLLGTWQRELKQWAGDTLKVNLYFGKERKAVAGMSEVEKRRPKDEPPAPKRRKLSQKQPAPSAYLPVPEKQTRVKKSEEHVETDVFLTSYGVFRSDAARRLSQKDIFGGMILDEAQQIKNYDTKISQEVKRVAELVGPVRVSLSGTPVENKMADLHSQFEFILPGYLAASRADFQKSYERPLQMASKRRSTLPNYAAVTAKEKLQQIIGPFMLRRKKTDPNIVPDLPDKVEMSHEVELTAFQRKLYKAVQEAYERDRAQLDRSAASYKLARSGAIFKMLQGLREICNHPACLDQKRRPSDVAAADYPAAEKEKASGKSEKLHELLEETIFPNNEKVLIFCTSLSAIDVLSKQIQRRFNTQPLVLQGDVAQKQRDALVQKFQTDDRCTVLLSSGVGGTGLTLTAATHVVHYDRCYNPAKEAQCTDRAHRIGQHRTVTVHTLTSQDSFEARLDEIMQRKRHLSDITSSSSENWIADYDDDEVRELFRLGSSRE